MTVRLADAYGFCWGVERAVQMAYEARRAYPDRKLHVTNEIIHNPSVNQVREAAAAANVCVVTLRGVRNPADEVVLHFELWLAQVCRAVASAGIAPAVSRFPFRM